jgi:hypothetical protein
MMMNFDQLPEFQKEFESLSRKYKSLPDDLKEFCNVVSAVPLGNSKHFNIITQTESLCVIKARLFCRYLKGSSLRIIYAYHPATLKTDFIEIYFKDRKSHKRIQKYLNH